jgi:tetratricopeptide (TPR) repeat protein
MSLPFWHHKKAVSILGLFILGGVASYFALHHFRLLSSKVVMPSNSASLDPAVQELVRIKAAAVTDRPEDASAHGDLGLVYEANSLWQEARACYEIASKIDPNEMLWKLHLAIAYRQTGAYNTALLLLNDLANRDPNVSYIQQRLGQAMLENGDLNGAEKAFRKLIDVAPNATQGYTGLSDILLQRGDYQHAIKLLETAVSLDPKYRTSHYLLGRAYQRLGMFDKAEAELLEGKNASIVFLPDPGSEKIRQYAVNLTTRLQMAKDDLNEGRSQQAAQLLKETLVYHPENVSLLNNLAVAYMRVGEIQQAEALLSKAQRQREGQFMTAINYSSLMLRTNRPLEALQHADNAIELAPNLDQAYFSRALALSRLGRYQEALVATQKTSDLNSQNPQAPALAGDLYMKLIDYEHAKQAYQIALKSDPKMLPALLGYARACMALHQYSEVETALVRARQIAPNHPLVQQIEQQFQRVVR